MDASELPDNVIPISVKLAHRYLVLQEEMGAWSERGRQAITAGAFQPTLVGYWPQNSQLAREQGSRSLCMSFPPPKSTEEESSLRVHLSLRLHHNNCCAYIYMSPVLLSVPENGTALMVVGVQGKEKACWVFPFSRGENGVEFQDGASIPPETPGDWANLLTLTSYDASSAESTFREAYDKLVEYGYGYKNLLDPSIREASAHSTKIKSYYDLVEKQNTFEGMSDLEIFLLARTFLASRNLLPDGEMHEEGKN